MFRSRPNLIVPIRDRRQRRRYLTLKNVGWLMLAAVIVFVVISIRSEMRGRPSDSYGRLVQKELPRVEQRRVEVVEEAPLTIDELTHADPTLLVPAARAQWLESPAPRPAPPANVTAAISHGRRGDLTIVGGPEGVSIVREERPKPVLSGGFGHGN